MDACGSATLLWLHAPAGSGKTTAAAGWLAQQDCHPVWYRTDADDSDPASLFKYLAQAVAPDLRQDLPGFGSDFRLGIPAFSRRWFEVWWPLVRRTDGRAPVLVFDDFQEAGADSLATEVVRGAFERMPADGRIVVLSRQPPPAAWARWVANGTLCAFGVNDIQLDTLEAEGIASMRRPDWPAEARTRASQASGGWPAGLVLLLQAEADTWLQPAHGRQAAHGHLNEQPEQLRHFFEHEVIRRLPAASVDVLRAAAWLPVAQVNLVEQILPTASAAAVMEALHQAGTFTLKIDRPGSMPAAYQFHPLFHAFLRSDAVQAADADLRKDLQRRTVQALVNDGQIEAAVQVGLATGQTDLTCDLLEQLRPHLLDQGRQRTLLRWLSEIPPSAIDDRPWLLLARGEALCALADPAGALDLQRAIAPFTDRDEHDGLALALNALATVIVSRPDGNPGEVSAITDSMAQLLARWKGDPGNRLWLLRGLTTGWWFRQPGDPQLDIWLADMHSSALAAGTPQALALWLHPEFLVVLTRGDHQRLHRAMRVLDGIETNLREPSLQAFCRFLRVYALNKLGRYEEGVRAYEEGASAAERDGALIWAYQISMHGVESLIGAGRLTEATRLLQALQQRVPVDRGFAGIFHSMLAGWIALHQNDVQQALRHAHQMGERLASADVALFHCLAPLCLGWVELAQGEAAKAAATFRLSMAKADRLDSPHLRKDSLLGLAKAHQDMNQDDLSRQYLAEALELAQTHHYWTTYYARPSDLSPLCARALKENLAPAYVRQWIAHQNLPAPPDLPQSWCWPLRIYTFGEFRIVRETDGMAEPIRFGPKAPRRLIQLLKLLVTLGGRNVSEERMVDTLWPELDADQGRAALKVAVSRLNALLGEPGAWIRQHDRQLSLDGSRVWVDTWSMDRLLSPASRDARAGSPEDWLALYRGPFLPADTAEAWADAERLHWRKRLVTALCDEIDRAEQAGNSTQAVRWCERGFDADPVAEALAVRAMRLFCDLGRRLDAVTVYERLKEALARDLGLRPSPQSSLLHRDIIAG